MKIAGRTSVGITLEEGLINTKRVARYAMPEPGLLAKGSIYLDGRGSGFGGQVCKMVVYDDTDNLLATSDEVTIADEQPPGWVDFRFSTAHGRLLLPKRDFYAGLHLGGNTNTIRMYGSGPHGMGGKQNADTYADGASAAFGAASATSNDLSLFVTYVNSYSAPRETDLYFARLPFKQSQDIFGATGQDRAKGERIVNATWHSTFLDAETGANALVRDGSTLADLLGERIRIQTIGIAKPRVVYAYVHDLMPANSDFDLSITRLLFSRLGLLSADYLATVLDVMA